MGLGLRRWGVRTFGGSVELRYAGLRAGFEF